MTTDERHQRDRARLPAQSVVLGLRVKAADAEVIRRKARELGLTVSQWIAAHLEGPVRHARESAIAMHKQRRDRD